MAAGLLRLGPRDAHRWLRRHPRFWCRDATHFARYDAETVNEQEATAEFRARRLGLVASTGWPVGIGDPPMRLPDWRQRKPLFAATS